jgi:hypothetical protein
VISLVHKEVRYFSIKLDAPARNLAFTQTDLGPKNLVAAVICASQVPTRIGTPDWACADWDYEGNPTAFDISTHHAGQELWFATYCISNLTCNIRFHWTTTGAIPTTFAGGDISLAVIVGVLVAAVGLVLIWRFCIRKRADYEAVLKI